MMTEDIRGLSAELARDPTSLVFLALGEALRKRGQLPAADRVVRAGLERHPQLADAHALLARIQTDRHDFEQAFESWSTVLDLVPGHALAHQGLGFLYFRAGDFERALSHLEEALRLAPGDRSIAHGIETVRQFAASRAAGGGDGVPKDGAPKDGDGSGNGTGADEVEDEGPSVFRGLEGAGKAVILLDRQGRLLAGGLERPDGTDVAEEVAAFLAGVSQECDRTARLLELGNWKGLSAETGAGHVHIVPPTTDTLLLLSRDRGVPLGRIAHLAERAAVAARRWLEEAE